MDKYPAGLWAKTKYFRVVKSVFTKECEKFVLSRMHASHRNIKPIIIIDDITKECQCMIPNDTLTGFVDENSLESKLLCLQVHQTATFQIEKVKIQKSNNTPDIKEKFGKLNEDKNYLHKSLSTKDEKELNKFMKDL